MHYIHLFKKYFSPLLINAIKSLSKTHN